MRYGRQAGRQARGQGAGRPVGTWRVWQEGCKYVPCLCGGCFCMQLCHRHLPEVNRPHPRGRRHRGWWHCCGRRASCGVAPAIPDEPAPRSWQTSLKTHVGMQNACLEHLQTERACKPAQSSACQTQHMPYAQHSLGSLAPLPAGATGPSPPLPSYTLTRCPGASSLPPQ